MNSVLERVVEDSVELRKYPSSQSFGKGLIRIQSEGSYNVVTNIESKNRGKITEGRNIRRLHTESLDKSCLKRGPR